MEDHKDLEFEVGSWTVTVDILSIYNNEIDFSITNLVFDPDMPIVNWVDTPDEDDVRDEVYYYAEEVGLINV